MRVPKTEEEKKIKFVKFQDYRNNFQMLKINKIFLILLCRYYNEFRSVFGKTTLGYIISTNSRSCKDSETGALSHGHSDQLVKS